MLYKITKTLLPTLLLFTFHDSAYADAKASLETHRDSVYQIKVINTDSQGRSSLGSGFSVGNGSLIATNYHVVNEAILEPKKYRIEIIDSQNLHEQAIIDRIDIINDLVILKRKASGIKPSIALATVAPKPGEAIFSLGNPHDLGMTITPGTYNGLESTSYIDIIHFSGAINEGMSGGPAINHSGEVIGINVATTGNQISFLIPVEKLQVLLSKQSIPSNTHNNSVKLNQIIEDQIKHHQSNYFQYIQSFDWQIQTVKNSQILAEISPDMGCWGDSSFDDNNSVSTINMGCSGNNNIFISSALSTGNIEYEYWLADAHDISSIRFYNYVEKRLESYLATNASSDNVVSNFRCNNDFIKVSNTKESNMKVSICVRNYLNFPRLNDIFFVASSYQKGHKVLISHFTLLGVNKGQAKDFSLRFMESVKWL